MGQGPTPSAEYMVGGVTDAAEAGGHDRILPQCTPGTVHGHIVPEAEHVPQE